MAKSTNYQDRGVSSQKEAVHNATKDISKGLFPNAFCTIYPDVMFGNPNNCIVLHADGAGTKSSLGHLAQKITGNPKYLEGIAQDALIMNIDDMIAVGCTGPFMVSNTIGRNTFQLTDELLSSVIKGLQKAVNMLNEHGIETYLIGGETADVPDLVRTFIMDATVVAGMKRDDVISENIQHGDAIIGLSSFGQAIYEDEYNGGMGSNGLTSARHDMFSHIYASDNPETFAPEVPIGKIYQGPYRIGQTIPIDGEDIPVEQLVLSPTRTYAPIIKEVLENVHKIYIHGMIHCSGGAQTKVLKFVDKLHIIKDKMFPIPPLFREIQKHSGTSWEEMYDVFNMGHRFELYVDNRVVDKIISISKSFGVDAQVIGRVEAIHTGKKLTITSEEHDDAFTY